MDDYFREIVKDLTIEDIALLNTIHDQDAVSKQKSIKVSHVMTLCDTTEAKYRKMVDKLVSLKFIVLNKDYKEHGLFISDYGINALTNTLENMEVVGR